MVTFLLFQSFGFRDGGGQYKSKNLKGQLWPSVNHEMFYQEKLRERALFLISKYTPFSFRLCFAHVLKALDMGYYIVLPRTTLHVYKLLTKQI